MIIKLSMISSIAGAMLINFLSRPPIYWGNMAVYVMSYHAQQEHSGRMINVSWFIGPYNFLWAVTSYVIDIMTRRVKPRYLVLAGILVFNSFFFVSVLCLEISWTASVFLVATVAGIGIGMFEILVLQHFVVAWSDSKGLVTTLYVSSSSVGAAVANQVITSWTNPHNLTPDLDIGSTKLFSSKEIGDRVPSMFLILGGTSLTLQLIGLGFLRERQREPEAMINDDLGSSYGECQRYDTFNYETVQRDRKPEHELCNGEIHDAAKQDKDLSESESCLDTKGESVFTTLCRREFQILYLAYCCITHTLDISASFYKVYGSLWIEDDHFFSNLATVMILPSTFTNVIIGICLDRFGVKLCFMVISASSSILIMSMYFAAMLGPSPYFAVTVTTFTFTSSIYPSVMAAAAIFFDNQNLTRNLAMLCSANVISTFSVSVVAEVFVENYGWYLVFSYGSFLCVVALIAITVFLPESK